MNEQPIPRFKVDDVVFGVHFAGPWKSLHGYRPAMIQDRVDPEAIRFYKLTVVSAHKVGLGPSGTIKPYDGYILHQAMGGNYWYNQYPYATGTPPHGLHDQMFNRDLSDLRGKQHLDALENENKEPYRCENLCTYLELLMQLISRGQSNMDDTSRLVHFYEHVLREFSIEFSGYCIQRETRLDREQQAIPHSFEFTIVPRQEDRAIDRSSPGP